MKEQSARWINSEQIYGEWSSSRMWNVKYIEKYVLRCRVYHSITSEQRTRRARTDRSMRIEYTVAFLYDLIKISAIFLRAACDRGRTAHVRILHEPVICDLHSRIRETPGHLLVRMCKEQRPCRQCCSKYVNIENSALRVLCGPANACRSMN